MIKKILALVCTGMPGFHRLLVFYLIEKMVDQRVFGLIAMDYSLVQMFSFFTAVGWCGLLVARTPKLRNNDKRIFLSKIVLSSLASYLVVLFIFLAMYVGGRINYLSPSLIFTLTWMLYQILRHYHMSEKNYLRICVGDASSIVLLMALLAFNIDPYFSLGLSFAFPIVILYFDIFSIKIAFIGTEEVKKVFEIGLFNFLIGLSSAALPFVIGQIGKVEYAGLLAYVTAIVAMLQLIPRAIGFYFMPNLVKNCESYQFREIYKKHVRLNHIVVALSTLLIVVLGMLFSQHGNVEVYELSDAIIIHIGLTICGGLLGFSLPYVNYFMVNEKTSYLRNVGIINSLLTLIAFIIFVCLSNQSVNFLVSSLIGIASIKLIYLYLNVRKRMSFS